MADSTNKNDPQPVVVVNSQIGQAPGPTEGMLQPISAEIAKKDPNARPTYMVDGVEVDPDGQAVKGKDSKDK